MVAGGDRDRVEVLVFQRLADVLHALGRVAAFGLTCLVRLVVGAAVGIDQVGDLDVLHVGERVDVAGAAAVDAGHAQANPVVGPEDLARGIGAGNGKVAAIPPAAACFRNVRRVCRDMEDSL